MVQDTQDGSSGHPLRSVSIFRSIWRRRSARTSCWLMSTVRPYRRLGVSSRPREGQVYLDQALMRRAFAIDVLACAHCGGRLRLIATLHDPAVIRKLLAHPGVAPSGPSPGPALPESGAVASRSIRGGAAAVVPARRGVIRAGPRAAGPRAA